MELQLELDSMDDDLYQQFWEWVDREISDTPIRHGDYMIDITVSNDS